jgi:hypothetical protein
MVERAKSTRATAVRQITASSSSTSTTGAGRGKRAPQAAAPKAGKRASNDSESSAVSSGTTAVTKTAVTKKAPVKKTVIGTIRGIGNTAAKKPLATTVATTKATAPTRVLRRRNQV